MATDYGKDVSCYLNGDLDPMFVELEGRQVLAEALMRRLETPRGGLFYDADYGLDLRGYLGEALDAADIVELQAAIGVECLKDERVVAAQARVALTYSTGEMLVYILVQDGNGPFELTLSVDKVTVSLLDSKL